MVKIMKISENGINLIKRFEGYASKPYWDFKGYSGGYGHLGISKDTIITKSLAEEWLKSDLQKFEANVNKFDAIYHFNQNQFDALVSFAYNIGSINKLCDNGKRSLAEISEHIPDYCHAGGKVNTGLVKRRAAEKALFDTPVNTSKLTEKEITICGHGSNKPSFKNMYEYLSSRYSSTAPNGVKKGIVAVVRLKSITDAKRTEIKANYASIIGRNLYSQKFREYCFIPHNNVYYSDCSSSIILSMSNSGFKFPWTLNTAAMYTETSIFDRVPVNIVNGHITNPEILRECDCLLFAGSDASRPLQIGHVEMIYNIDNDSVSEQYPKWVQAGNDWYYRIAPGKNQHGWAVINHHKYYFDEKGKMLTGWQEIESGWYYFTQTGSLKGAMWKSDENGKMSIAEC